MRSKSGIRGIKIPKDKKDLEGKLPSK